MADQKLQFQEILNVVDIRTLCGCELPVSIETVHKINEYLEEY